MQKISYALVGLAMGAGVVWFANATPETADAATMTALEDGATMQVQAEPVSMTMSHADMTGMDNDANEANHAHPLREVNSALPAPTLTHLVFPDAMDGYNIQILTEDFRFTPASINREVVDNEGHAHLYVNGEKIARVYSNWVHLPSGLLEPGVNFVSVTLNANDHSEWAVNGAAIASTVRVIVAEG